MSNSSPLTLQVSVDVGCSNHNVAVGLSTGELLEEFAITHQPEGFRQFFSRIEVHEQRYNCTVKVLNDFFLYGYDLDKII